MLSRKDRHVMTEILHALVAHGERKTNIIIDEDDYSLSCREGGPTDEGYSVTYYEIATSDEPDWYEMSITTRSRDCDGRYDHTNEGLVKLRSKPQRFYMNHDWKTGKPVGSAMYRKLSWRKQEYGQRDYSAEAAGY